MFNTRYFQTVITSRYMLEYILESRGKQLKSLNLATNILVKFDIVMQSIMVNALIFMCSGLSHIIDTIQIWKFGVILLSSYVVSRTIYGPLRVEGLLIDCD